MNKKLRILGIIAVFVAIIVTGTVNAQEKAIEDALSSYGLEEPKVSISGNEVAVGYKQKVSELGTVDEDFRKIAKILTIVSNEFPNTGTVKIGIYFDDGQIMEIIGKPEDGKAFLSGQISTEIFWLERLEFKPLTRGPPIVPGICEPDKGENCENCEECACYPNEICDPDNPEANERGCVVVHIPANSHLVGSEYVCDEGYEWNADLTNCIPEKKCPSNAFKFQGECYCNPGYEWDSDRVKCILKEEPEITPTPTSTKFNKCVGDEPYLYVEDRIMEKTVEIPIIMCNAEDLANMDLNWSYNASVLKLINVTKGSLNEKALFNWNEVSQGKLKIAFASSEGVTGSGSIAVMKFEVIGNTGDTSTLTGTVTTASKTDGTEISVGVTPGEFTVGTAPIKGALKISDLRGTLNTDNDCNLYVADWGDNQVKMINPDGSTTTYASGIDRPRYQVFDSAGNLYVGSFDGNIYNVSASGGKTTVASGIWSPQGMGFDSAGNLYVAGSYDGKIHRIAPDGSKTTMDSGFAHPKHLAVYSNGNIYVVDSGGTLIVRITPEGEKANLVDLGETISGMATDGEYLYVSHSDKISRIDTSGQVTQIATGLDQPSSLTVCKGSVFVTVRDGIVKLKISDETKTGTCDWTGAWETDWGRMELQQNGNKVNGTYTHDQGRIQGTVSGRNLTGTWSEYPSYSPPGDAGDIVFIISEDCSSFDGKWRYGTSGGWSGSWTGARTSTGSGTSYLEATLTHSGFDFSEGTTGESPTYDGEVIYWQPGHAGTHPDYPDYSEYLWWRNTHLDDVNRASQTKDMGAVDIATVREVPAEWDKPPLIPPLLVGHTIVAKCYDGYVKFQVISVDTTNESARVKYWYSPDTTFDEGTPTLQPTP